MRALGWLLLPVVFGIHDASASTVPVYVTVRGTGSIRVLLTGGRVMPCDSSSNAPIYDGWLEAGRTYSFASASVYACERHTTGHFRQVGWTNDRIWRVPRTLANPNAPFLIDIQISTDG